jgi:energy-coupling factor transporter ATP-binding protein EcfA2
MPKQQEFHIKLKRFNIHTMEKNRIVAVLGRKGSGKSTLIKDILYHVKDIPVGTVISPTEELNEFFSDIVPPIFIHPDYDESIVDRFVDRQRLIIKKHKEQIKRFGKSNIDYNAYLILDDCMYDNTWCKDKSIRFMFTNGRHTKALFLFTLQYPLGIPPTLRTNVDYVFIYKDDLLRNRRIIYENYASVFPTFDIFCVFMEQCTQNYECLVIDNTCVTGKLEDKVFWYKANLEIPDFKMGDEEFWNYGKDTEFEYNDEINEYNPNKKRPNIHIDKTY